MAACFRERWPDVPLLLMTGDGEGNASGDAEFGANAPELRRLTKPFVWETVLDAVDKAVNPGSS